MGFLVILAVSVPDRPDDRREVSGGSAVWQEGAVRAGIRVDQPTPSAHADHEPYEVDLRGSSYWPPMLSTRFTVRPTLSSSGVGYQIESDLGDAILTRDGLTVTDPKLSAAVGLQAGDRIVSVDGHPPVGGAFLTMIGIQRDPDRNVVSVQLERRGQRTMRTVVLR